MVVDFKAEIAVGEVAVAAAAVAAVEMETGVVLTKGSFFKKKNSALENISCFSLAEAVRILLLLISVFLYLILKLPCIVVGI